MLIEQAIFASAQTATHSGYHLAARSPGVTEEQARQLALWCPSHGGMVAGLDTAASLNFHALGTGAWCISRTIADGQEYSGRGGAHLRTHALVVPGEVLARFGNQPFAVARAALAKGLLGSRGPLPRKLEAGALCGRTSGFEEQAVGQFLDHFGAARLAGLVDMVLGSHCLSIKAPEPLEAIMSALVSCLPISWRTGFSFCTALRYARQRPFRILPFDEEAPKHGSPDAVVRHFDISSDPPATKSLRSGWARFLGELLRRNRKEQLAAAVASRGADMAIATKIGVQERAAVLDDLENDPRQMRMAQAHAPHARKGQADVPIGAAPVGEFSVGLGSLSPQAKLAVDQFENLLGEALAGRFASVIPLARQWSEVASRLSPQRLAALHEASLARTVAIWGDSTVTVTEPMISAHLDVLQFVVGEMA